MAGLLTDSSFPAAEAASARGLLGSSWDDPRTAATLQLAMGLLGPGRGAQRLTVGAQGYMQAIQAAKQADEEKRRRALQEQILALQVQQAQGGLQDQQAARAEAERQRQAEAGFRSRLTSPQMQASQVALAGGGGPTMANAAKMPAVSQQDQLLFEAMQAGLVKPMDYVAATRKETAPIKLSAGETLLDPRTLKPLASNPKAEDKPSQVREYEYAKAQGYPGTFQQFVIDQRRAGAPVTNLNVNTQKNMLETMATGLGKQLDDGLSAARGAQASIQTAQTLRQAVDSGKLISGPGADARVFAAQLAQTLGVGGKDTAEQLKSTRQAIQAMAKAELDAAQMMKGQGQITEAERDIIRRAAAGMINMTAGEIRQLADAMEKTGRGKIAAHQASVQKLRNLPGADSLIPFYSVEMPPEMAAPVQPGGGWSIRQK